MPGVIALSPKQQFTNSTGVPLVSGTVDVYVAGTTTRANTWQDKDRNSLNANPIVLNSRGECTIWLAPNASYDLVLKDSSGTEQYTVEDVYGLYSTNDGTEIKLSSVAGTDTITATAEYLTAYAAGQMFTFVSAGTNTGAVTLNINGLGAKAVTKGGTVSLGAGDIPSGAAMTVVYDGTRFQVQGLSTATALTMSTARMLGRTTASTGAVEELTAAQVRVFAGTGGAADYTFLNLLGAQGVPMRQTVLSGPVDSSGLPNFGGSTGSGTVTASGTLVVTASQGTVNRIGSSTNPSWTSLTTNGTMYLYLDIAADGSCTTGSTTLAPTYRWGGTDVTTNLQNTFNIQEMTMKVGNGTVATAVYRVFVGQVTVAGGVVTAITWYALMGRAFVTQSTIAVSTAYALTHNIGTNLIRITAWYENKTTEGGWAVGDRLTIPTGADGDGSGGYGGMTFGWTGLVLTAVYGALLARYPNKSTGAQTNMTAANWSFGALITRSW